MGVIVQTVSKGSDPLHFSGCAENRFLIDFDHMLPAGSLEIGLEAQLQAVRRLVESKRGEPRV